MEAFELKRVNIWKYLAVAVILMAVSGLLFYGCGSDSTVEESEAGHKLGAELKSEAEREEGSQNMNTETIVFGGGCFWCTEAVFNMVKGITDTTVGYAGGTTVDPDYQSVCGGNTGHAEVVSITFDPEQVRLDELLELFFASHDPTTLNRQGADVGTQYRSLILYTSEDQLARIENYITGARADFSGDITTEVAPLDSFYPAEDYHQDYYEKNPDAPYCSTVISPKVEKVKKMLEE